MPDVCHGLRDQLTLAKLRLHLLRFRFRGSGSAPRRQSPGGNTAVDTTASIDLASPGGSPFVPLPRQGTGSHNRSRVRQNVAETHRNVRVSGSPLPDPEAVPAQWAEAPALGAWEDEGGALLRGGRRRESGTARP